LGEGVEMFKYLLLIVPAFVLCFILFFDFSLTNEKVGNLFITAILACLFVFLFFKFGLHYKIQALNRFTISFYYAVFEYRKAQQKPSHLSYVSSVREQADIALAANFDPSVTKADIKIPVTLYSGRDAFLENLRSKIYEAERIKAEARQLDSKANVILGKTQEMLVEQDLQKRDSALTLDSIFDIENGVAHIVDLTVEEIKDQSYSQTPDYEILTRVALENNPYFSTTYRYFHSQDVVSILHRAPFMIILLGIIGTFSGFYLALNAGGDMKSGAAVAIVSSLVGLPVSLLMDYINTLFPDKTQYQQAFNKYKISLEILFNHEKELDSVKYEDELDSPVPQFTRAR
jgi:hypothetical protein